MALTLEEQVRANIESHGKKLEALETHQSRSDNIMIGILIVVGLGFIGFLLQQFTATQTAFDNLTNQINQQNSAIQVLGAKIDALPKK